MREENKTLYKIGVIAAVIVAILFLISKIFDIAYNEMYPPCIFHYITGYYCPGCGGTRAVEYLMQGKIIKSFIYHPIVIYVAVYYVLFMGSNTVELVSKRKWKIGIKYRDLYIWIGLGIVVLNCIIKNALYLIWGIIILK